MKPPRYKRYQSPVKIIKGPIRRPKKVLNSKLDNENRKLSFNIKTSLQVPCLQFLAPLLYKRWCVYLSYKNYNALSVDQIKLQDIYFKKYYETLKSIYKSFYYHEPMHQNDLEILMAKKPIIAISVQDEKRKLMQTLYEKQKILNNKKNLHQVDKYWLQEDIKDIKTKLITPEEIEENEIRGLRASVIQDLQWFLRCHEGFDEPIFDLPFSCEWAKQKDGLTFTQFNSMKIQKNTAPGLKKNPLILLSHMKNNYSYQRIDPCQFKDHRPDDFDPFLGKLRISQNQACSSRMTQLVL